MIISKDFPGGNISVIKITNKVVQLENIGSHWFYWAFSVENVCDNGEESRTVRFEFPTQGRRIGAFGAAVSEDLINWKWTNNTENNGFSYTFHKNDKKLYFSFCFIYNDIRLSKLMSELNLKTEFFCRSRNGRTVPCFTIGNGSKTVLITSRHHACESTGTFIMEGVAKAAKKAPLEGYRFLFVPFVDYDGVVDGDQGKNRSPHDHNRDYPLTEPSIYPETAKIRELADSNEIYAFFDLHSPEISGKEFDHFYFLSLSGPAESWDTIKSELSYLSNNDPDSFKYNGNWDLTLNLDITSSVRYLAQKCVSGISGCAEMTYFGLENNKFSTDSVTRLGEHLYTAICKGLDKIPTSKSQ